MNRCQKCNNHINNCNCNVTVVNSKIKSDQAGRPGPSAKDIVISQGKLPANASDADFVNFITGKDGENFSPQSDSDIFY